MNRWKNASRMEIPLVVFVENRLFFHYIKTFVTHIFLFLCRENMQNNNQIVQFGISDII